MNQIEKLAAAGLTFCAFLVFTEKSRGADVFVRDARNVGAAQTGSREQIQKISEQVTDMVKRAVRRMPEHTLIQTENMADFVLAPTLISKNHQLVLRVENYQDGEFVGESEDVIHAVSRSGISTYAVTEGALLADTNGESTSGSTTGAIDGSSGDLRAASPLFHRRDTSGFFQAGVGPSVTSGIGSNTLHYDINLAYNSPINEFVVGKAFGDASFGSASDPSHFIEAGLGAEFYPWGQALANTTPYFAADLGFAFVRDNVERNQSALATGGGAGLKFTVSDLILDLSLHYAVLTTKLLNNNPSVLGLRVAFNF